MAKIQGENSGNLRQNTANFTAWQLLPPKTTAWFLGWRVPASWDRLKGMTTIIRVAQLDDAADILAIYAPYCTSSNVTFETSPPTIEEMVDRISRIATTYPWLVAEADGRVVGYVYATRFRERVAYRWTVEVAVYIASSHKRCGLAQALYTSLFSILRTQGFSKVVAGITVPNPASVALHERMGFHPTGFFPGVGHKDGEWLDVGWWQLELQPEIASPTEPQAFPLLRESVAVAAALDEGRRLANP